MVSRPPWGETAIKHLSPATWRTGAPPLFPDATEAVPGLRLKVIEAAAHGARLVDVADRPPRRRPQSRAGVDDSLGLGGRRSRVVGTLRLDRPDWEVPPPWPDRPAGRIRARSALRRESLVQTGD